MKRYWAFDADTFDAGGEWKPTDELVTLMVRAEDHDRVVEAVDLLLRDIGDGQSLGADWVRMRVTDIRKMLAGTEGKRWLAERNSR